jgi:hypothetical protein
VVGPVVVAVVVMVVLVVMAGRIVGPVARLSDTT